jgi:peptide/nickel transport system substrate-binding protein
MVGLVAAATGPASSKSSSGARHLSSAQAKAKGTVSIALAGDPGKLDPQQTLLVSARQLDDFTYDHLVNQLPGGGKIVSGLASKWKVLSPTAVRFTLHKGITCTDGTKLTAGIVKQNLAYVGNPKNNSPLLNVYVPPNPKIVANNKKRTVTVTLSQPNPFPLQGLAAVHIICAHGLANRNSLLHGADGSGPYKLVKVSPGSKYTLALRKGYKWGPNGATSKGMPAKVVLKVVNNETTAANLLLTGGLNVAGVTGPDRSRLEAHHLFKKSLLAEPGEIWINENKGHPGANAKVRKGIVQALQVKQFGKIFTSGHGVPQKQLTLQTFSPCGGNSVKGNVPAHNESAARAALSGHPSLKLLYPNDGGTGFSSAMALAQAQLDQAGASAQLDGTTTPQLQAILFGTGDWDVALVPLGVTSPVQLVGFLSGPAPVTNFAGINNATYEKDVATAMKKPGTAGCKSWLAAEAAIFKHADLVPTSWNTAPIFGRGVKFGLGGEGVAPTTLRLTKKKK